jgi:hypothetical protein
MEDPVKPCYAENPFHKQRKSTVFVEETDSDSKGVKRVILKIKIIITKVYRSQRPWPEKGT